MKKDRLYRFVGNPHMRNIRELGTVIECTGSKYSLYVVQLVIDGVKQPSSPNWWHVNKGDKYEELSDEEAIIAKLAQ